MVGPPSTVAVAPVTTEASNEQRNAMALATDPELAVRRMRVMAVINGVY